MATNPSKGKIGEGHGEAWLRQGLAELREVFYPDSNVQAPTQLGLYGTRTPQEITEARRGQEMEAGAPASELEQRLERDDASTKQPEKDTRDLDRD
jgi:hypothetical protein